MFYRKTRLTLFGLITCLLCFLLVLHWNENPSCETDKNDESEYSTGRRYWSAENLLVNNNIPNVVHYVWCGDRYFGFKNYLSVKSAIKAITADKVILHSQLPQKIDELFYYQWIDNLKYDFPFFEIAPLSDSFVDICNHATSKKDKINIILNLMNKEGGIYVSENVFLLDMEIESKSFDFEYAVNEDNLEGYMMMKKNFKGENETIDTILSSTKGLKRKSSCMNLGQFYLAFKKGHCLIVSGPGYDNIFPMDVWDKPSRFAKVCRKIFYGKESVPLPKPTYDELVPNIGHMIWIGGGDVNFVFYLSILSMLYIAKVDKVYIHGDIEPINSFYWQKLRNNERLKNRLFFIYRPQPTMIFGGTIEWYYRALMSDLIRVDLMIKYGGIYTDTDAIWVKPLSEKDYGYDAVASYDWIDWSWPFPDTVNFGISYGKRNARFWHIFLDSMRTLHNDKHGFTGVMMPYKLLERYPDLLRIDRRLSVICYQLKCHPTWVKGYHNESNNHVTTNSIPDWRNDVNVFHWTHPNPPELSNETILMNSKGLFADIGKYVLKNAGLL